MNKLTVTYSDSSTEDVTSDLSAEEYFDSRFGGLPQEVLEKCSVVGHEAKPVAKPEKSESKAAKATK